MQRRPGTTEKISISVRASDLVVLRRRAKRLYAGNVSVVIAELAADAALLEGMHQLVEQLGGPTLAEADRVELDREWARHPPAPTRPRRKRKVKKVA